MPITVRSSGIAPQGPQNVGGPRASAAQFGGQQARALMNQGESIGRQGQAVYNAWQKAETEHDNARVLEATMALQDGLQQLDSEYKQNKQGKDALNAMQDYNTSSAKLFSSISEKLDNDRQKEQLKKQSFSILHGFVGNGMNYQLSQEKIYKTDQLAVAFDRVITVQKDPAATDAQCTESVATYNAVEDSIMPKRLESLKLADKEQIRAARKKGTLQAYAIRMESDPAQTSALLGEMDNNPWGKMQHVPKDLQEKLTPQEYTEFRKNQLSRRDSLIMAKRAAAERAHKSALNLQYTQWRCDARKSGLNLESTQLFMTQHITDNLATLEERKYVMDIFEKDLKIEKIRQNAEDMTGIIQAEEATRGMLHSEKLIWLENNWKGSRKGRERAEEILAKPPKLETVENLQRLGELRIAIDLGHINTTGEAIAAAYENGLTAKQTGELLTYHKQGGQSGLIKDLDVKNIWDRQNRKVNGASAPMPPDLPELVRRELQSDNAGKYPNSELLNKTIARLALTGESRVQGKFFVGFGKDESRSDALRNNRASSWLPDDSVPVYKNLQKSGMDVKIWELLQQHGITPTAEKIVLFSQDKASMQKYGLTK